MPAETPPPFPTTLVDDVAFALRKKSVSMLDDSGRFVVRRLVAAAYARGHADGERAERRFADTDRAVKRDAETAE